MPPGYDEKRRSGASGFFLRRGARGVVRETSWKYRKPRVAVNKTSRRRAQRCIDATDRRVGVAIQLHAHQADLIEVQDRVIDVVQRQ